jgi:Arc/MetJ-type ribon-helix-helix transcriptional regulator
VTISVEQFEQIKRLVEQDAGRYPSMSAFVAEAIADRLGDEYAHEMLITMLREIHGEPTADDIAWADEALRIPDETARRDPDRDVQGAA